MSRTPARFTEADLNRAVKVASKHSQRVLIHPDGDHFVNGRGLTAPTPTTVFVLGLYPQVGARV